MTSGGDMGEQGLRISVVIPAFEAERWVGDAIRSVLEQTPRVHELIVVDDGSRDATADVAAAVGGIEVVRQANAGAAAARNAGARRATGDAVLFLDADDALLPGAVAALRRTAASSDGWTALVPNYVRVGAAGGPAWDPAAGDRVLGRRQLATLVRGGPVSVNALVRTDAWRRRPFDEGLRRAEDLDFWLAMLLGDGRIVRLSEPLVRVRVDRPRRAPSNLRSKRAGRRRVLARLLRRRDLTIRERILVGARLARTAVGVLVAPRDDPRATLDALHVHLEDAGGGPAHVRLLVEALRPGVLGRDLGLDPRALGATPLGWLSAWRSLMRATRDRPDLIHAHGVRAAAAAAPVALARRRPLVVTVHGLHSLRRSPGRLTRWANRLALLPAAAVLVLSDSDRALVERGRIASSSKVRRIRAAVPARSLIPSDDARRQLGLPASGFLALWLGRLAPEKDPEAFVRAVAGVRGEAGVVGAIAGDGPLRSEVDALVAASEGHVLALGWVEDPWAALCAADAFVGTSRWEGRSMATLEAARAGCPLILVDRPGSGDLVGEGIPAILVPDDDDAALGRALVELARDPARREDLGRATERAAAVFDPAALAEDVLATYRDVLANT